ncbi:MAG TPA: L-2-amino-thiazoline-4-carboxylic acid hydrolase [Longimicrobium sp.]|nr:L-2-amino-thiazoline-4-carboxylic acid hydrolase [Longimicrobium sp.]
MVFHRAAVRVLGPALPREDVDRVWGRTRALQRELRKTRPRHSLGVNLVLRLFEWDRALYGALLEAGVPADDAGRWIAEINWMILGPSTALNFSLSRLRSGDLRTRVQSVVDLLFAVVFTAPFRRIVHPAQDEVAFDVTRCPLAEYFAAQGTPELTRHAACSLDYRMAEQWGVTLQRTRTIAAGHPLCDFRFQLHPRALPTRPATPPAMHAAPPSGPVAR